MTPHAIRMLTAVLAVVACLTFSPDARAEWQLYHIVFADNDDDLDYQEGYTDSEDPNKFLVLFVWKDGTRATLIFSSDNPGPDDPVSGKGDLQSRIDLASKAAGANGSPNGSSGTVRSARNWAAAAKVRKPYTTRAMTTRAADPAIRASTRKSSADRCSSTKPAISAPAKAAAFKSMPDRRASRSRNLVVPAGTRAATATTMMMTKAVRLPIRVTDQPNWSIRSGRSSSRSRQQAATTSVIAMRKKRPASHRQRKRSRCSGPLSNSPLP